MHYHDYLLSSYKVLDLGKTIELELLPPDSSSQKSEIKFSDVALYNFIHTQSSIILDIEEVDLDNLLNKFEVEINEWNRWHGVTHWKKDFNQYKTTLIDLNFRAWEINSSIGLYGFIIAKTVQSN